MSIPIEYGWVPSDIKLLDNGSYCLKLVYLGKLPLKEICLDFDLHQKLPIRYLSLSDVIELGKITEFEAPPGIIFHVSRCGSTLVTESLRTLNHCRIVSEPKAITDLFQMKLSERNLIFGLRGLVKLFYQSLCFNQQKLVIKLTSWLTAYVPVIQAALIGAQYCLLIRNPVEVIVSLLNTPPVWISVAKQKGNVNLEQSKGKLSKTCDSLSLLANRIGVHSTITDEEIYARFLGQIYTSAISASEPLTAVNYQRIQSQFFSHIAPLFQININGLEASKIRMISKINIKSYGHFQADSESKTSRATPELLEAIERYTMPHYKQMLNSGMIKTVDL